MLDYSRQDSSITLNPGTNDMNGNFYGLPTKILANDHLRLEYLAEAGPRIVRLSLAGSKENLLAEVPDFTIATSLGDYHIYGGHRLWHSPEAKPRSYIQDDRGLVSRDIPDGVELIQPVEALTGIRKSMRVRLHPSRPAVTVEHELGNEGVWPVELSPWALTQLRTGGITVLPQPTEPVDPEGLLPNRHFTLWPYSRWGDPRLSLEESCILIHARPQLPPFKIGYLNTAGWIGYWYSGTFLCKRFDPRPQEAYPDFGCNAEAYCNDQFAELESLGPLVRLAPGESTRHVETWEIYQDLEMPDMPVQVRQALERVIAAVS